MSVFEWIFQGLNLEGKTVLDAATGAGEATTPWAKYIHEHRHNARIVSVDYDLKFEPSTLTNRYRRIDRTHGDGYLWTLARYVLKSTKYLGEGNENN